ncbi:M48 family metallopeptidase [Rhizobium sullae]|uniref:M48 metallopeptidase family protein n=1 Tax=Rhizobium sullae TaxID=50338 RepID=UPI000B35BE13
MRTIRLNLDLAKKPAECLDYVILHEMLHFLVPVGRQARESRFPGKPVGNIAASQIRKPEQAQDALEFGLSLVAVGQDVVMG